VEKLLELLAALTACDVKIDALLAHDQLTDEQRAENTALEAERAKLVSGIAREKTALARAEERAVLEAEATAAAKVAADRLKAGTGRKTETDLPKASDVPAERNKANFAIPASVKRFGTLNNFKGNKDGVDADVRAYRFGMWGLAMLSIQMPGRYNFRKAVEDFPSMFGAASQSVDGNGTHYLIPHEFGTDMIVLREKYGVARRLLRKVPMMSDTRSDPRRKGGLTASFPGEGNAAAESNKAWDDVNLTAKDLIVLSRYSANVNADAVINFGDDLAGEISYAFSHTEDLCAFMGDATSPFGHIMGIVSKLKNVDGLGTVSAGLVTGSGNTWGALVLKDFNSVVGALPQYADTDDACWLMHRTFYYGVIEPLIQAAGGVTAVEVREGTRKPRPIFQGYPVEFSQVWPNVSASGSVVCALGDFAKGCAFGDRMEDSIAFSEHATIGGQNVFERNQIAIRGIERFDVNIHDVGDGVNPGPVTALKVA
jgi:HK97 family phage major capsid protein